MSSIKFQISHPNEEGCTITGIIEQLNDAVKGTASHAKPIALILHGVMGHKNYLFQKKLAQSLPIDSCRFDFRGNHESNGSWHMGRKGLLNDLQDVDAVVAYLKSQYGYRVDLVIGHSRGSTVGMQWLAASPEGQRVSGFVNVSARYRVKLHPYWELWREPFEKAGIVHWKVRVAGKQVVRGVTPEDMRDFEKIDTTFVWTKFPTKTDVLTIHGLTDILVPPSEAMILARAFSNRPNATHTLHFVEKADHSFVGHYDEVVETILGWWDQKTTGTLKDGVWLAGVKPKL